MRSIVVALVFCVLGSVSMVEAQTNVEKAQDEQTRLYERGFLYMGQGDWLRAAKMFQACEAANPTNEKGSFCRELAIQSDKIAKQKQQDEMPSGKTELMLYGATHGVWTGVALGIASDSLEGLLLMSGLGGVAGLGVGYLLGDDVTPGEAALITLSGNLGVWNGIAGMIILDGFDTNTDILIPLGAGYLGMGLAVALSSAFEPSEESVALANSGAFWGTFLSGMGLLIADPDNVSERGMFSTLLLGTDLGAAFGVLVAEHVVLTRTRVRFMDLGGGLGGVIAGGLLVALEANIDGPQVVGLSLTAGALSGGALALYLTEPSPSPGPSPSQTTESWELNMPSAFVKPHRHGERVGWAAGLNLLDGRF